MAADSPLTRPSPTPGSPPPGSPGAPSTQTAKSVIGPDVVIKGNLTSTGTVEVMGVIDGKVDAHALILGGEGRIKGTLSADTVDLRGQMQGKVSCISLTLRASAKATADVNYRSLAVESGAEVEGRFTLAKG